MKKKILTGLLAVMIIFQVGCSMNNTPTKRVEAYLNNYKTLNDDVLTQLDNVVEEDTLMTNDQKESYKDVLKKQYQNLTYTIKDEKVDGDVATVTAEIEVYDYYKFNKEQDSYYEKNSKDFVDDNGNVSITKYLDYKLDKMKTYTEKVKYTIDFTLRKVDKTWVLDDIDEQTRQKIHGLYVY